MARPAPALLATLALAALAACGEDDAVQCPGEALATLRFEGQRVARGDPALATLDPSNVADCGAQVGHPDVLPPLVGTLSAGPEDGAAALCRPRGSVLRGERDGQRFAVATQTAGGAILGACSPSCAAALRLVVVGDLAVDEDGALLRFDGVLVEELVRVDGECGECLPAVEGSVPARSACAARYRVVGTP